MSRVANVTKSGPPRGRGGGGVERYILCRAARVKRRQNEGIPSGTQKSRWRVGVPFGSPRILSRAAERLCAALDLIAKYVC
jgi:hypothetical protein